MKVTLKASPCPNHPYRDLPCAACWKLAMLYREPEPVKSRTQAVLSFTDENPGIIHLTEGHVVFVELSVDDVSVNRARRQLNEMVWRLAPYPDFIARRTLASRARDLLEGFLEE